MRVVLEKTEAKQIIHPIGYHFLEIYDLVLADYINHMNQRVERGIIDPPHITFRKTFFWEHATQYSKKLFSSYDHVKTGFFNQVFGVLIDSKIFVRFKSVDNQRKSRNNPTSQSELLDRQGQCDGFPPVPTIVLASYRMNKTWSDFTALELICYNNSGEVQWYIDLVNDLEYEAPKLIEIQPQTETKSLLRSKLNKQKHGNSDLQS